MPKINVYVTDALAAAVKDSGVPVSAVCQAALSDAVDRVGRARRAAALLRERSTTEAALARLGEALQRRMTPRPVSALAAAPAAASSAGGERAVVTSADLLAGVLADEENLAVRVLVALGADIGSLRELSRSDTTDEMCPFEPEPAGPLFGRLSMPARSACAAALEVAFGLGHNYLGCEHLLVGLTESQGGSGEILAGHGARSETVRQTLAGAVAGVVHERDRVGASAGGDVSELARRIEALERRLDARPTAQPV
jgi:post-segregation antitoxin (ccd killing protein)